MRKDKRRIVSAIIIVWLCGIAYVPVFAEVNEQRQEKDIEKASESLRRSPFQFDARASANLGFDSNVFLDSSHKGDLFDEFLLTTSFKKDLTDIIKGRLSYFVDYVNYHECTDVSSLFNRLAASVEREFDPYSIGVEASLAYLYYPNFEPGNTTLYRGELFFRHPYWFLKKAKGKAFVYTGIKDYANAAALNDELGLYLDNERLDKQYGLGYEVAGFVSKKTFLIFSATAEKNDSNAQYVDYYDYYAYRAFLELDYRITKRAYLLTALGAQRKRYISRTVTLCDYEERENLYTANIGVVYRLNRNTSLTANYGYRQNHSNEPLDRYSESMSKVGVELRF